MTSIHLPAAPDQTGQPDAFGLKTVATVLKRERAVFEANARGNCDVSNLAIQERIIAAFTAVEADIAAALTDTMGSAA